MNILIFSWRDPKHPLAGGAEQVMHEHMKGWVKAGHKVTLFSSKFKGVPEEEIIDDIRIIRRGYQYYLGVQLAGFLYYQKYEDQYDFVVDQFHGMPFFTPLYVKKPKLAVIQETAREVWFLNPLPKPLNWIIGFIGYLSEPFIFLLYKNIVFMTGSQSAKSDITKFGIPKNNIFIIPHGVLVKKPSPFPKKETIKTLAFLGVLSRDKGIEDAIRAFKILNGKGKFNFWIIGRSETEEYGLRLKQLVTKDFGGNLVFWDFVSQEKKFELLAKAHVLINPSVKEGWGLVNIEANRMGTPVVAYKASGLIDSVNDGKSGILCQENTPENLAENILRILDDSDLYHKLCKDSVVWSNNFTWDKSKTMSINLIKKIVNPKA